MNALFNNDNNALIVIEALSDYINEMDNEAATDYINEYYPEALIADVESEHIDFIRNYLATEFTNSNDSYYARVELVEQ